jgi:hypothetical protein
MLQMLTGTQDAVRTLARFMWQNSGKTLSPRFVGWSSLSDIRVRTDLRVRTMSPAVGAETILYFMHRSVEISA